MEDNVINPIVDPVVDAPMDATLTAPTDEIVPAPPVGTEPIPAEPIIPADNECPTCPEGDGCPDGEGCPVCPEGEEGCPVPVTVGMLFGTIQECVTITWEMHLKTRNYHTHNELHKFYENALKDIDDIIEQYQGIAGVVDEPYSNTIVGCGKSEVEYLRELKSFVENNKHILGGHSEIDSSIDTFLGHIDKAISNISQFNESAVKSYEAFCYEDINEGCSYDRFGDRTSDDPDDPDYVPEDEGGESCCDGESCGEEEEEEEEEE